MEKQEFSHEFNLHTVAEELYFWLMRSLASPKAYADTFRLLSQIMRISQISNAGGDYLPKYVEREASEALYFINEQLLDRKIQISNLFEAIEKVLQRLIQENTKAQLIAYATEVEYIFCIHATYKSSIEASYQQNFKEYLKALVNTVHKNLSEIQAKAITQVLSQIAKNPRDFSTDPKKSLIDSLGKSGIIIINLPSIRDLESG